MWDSEAQITQTNIHADRVQLISVHLPEADNPVSIRGFGGLRNIDCEIKQMEKSAEQSH